PLLFACLVTFIITKLKLYHFALLSSTVTYLLTEILQNEKDLYFVVFHKVKVSLALSAQSAGQKAVMTTD
ncbi:hypothetical protein, partial [Caldanaerobacter subterraneus]|uniref:hypothetical protein n=1 Tax=Caldanaerobacter subterraneus TaxID=911092 RepID=UPI001A9EE4E8